MTFLSWQEWKIYQAKQSLAEEKGLLQDAVRDLDNLLQQSPDPVRAQFVVNQINNLSNTPLSPSMQPIYTKLLTASEAVQDWSNGMLDWQSAKAAVDQVHNHPGMD